MGVCVLVFFIPLAVYFLTFAREITFVDSGELALTSATLGVAHSPGMPLYTLVGYIFSLIPLGTVAERLSFMSAFFAALTCFVVYKIVFLTLSSSFEKDSLKVKWVATITALAYGLSETLWKYASVVEVYTLNTCLLALVFYFLLRWKFKEETRALYASAFLFGCVLSVHYATAAIVFPGLIVLVLSAENLKSFLKTKLLKCAAFALLGLSFYVYLFISAKAQSLFLWTDTSTWDGLYFHVAGKQYSSNLFSSSVVMSDQFLTFAKQLVFSFTPIFFVFAILPGLKKLYAAQRGLFFSAVFIVVTNLLFCLGWFAAEDNDAYMMASQLVLVFPFAYGVLSLIKFSEKRLATTKSLVLVGVCIAGLLFVQNFNTANKRKYEFAKNFALDVTAALPQGGLLITWEWSFSSPYLYLRHLENFRQDAIVVDANLLRKTTYIKTYLRRVYPALMEACQAEVEALIPDLERFERGLNYDKSTILVKIAKLLNAMIAYGQRNNGAFLMLPVMDNLGKEYGNLPNGLIVEVFSKGQENSVWREEPPLHTKAILDLDGNYDETLKMRVVPNYISNFSNRVIYLLRNGRGKEAEEKARVMIALNDQDPRGHVSLARALKFNQNVDAAIASLETAVKIDPGNQEIRTELLNLKQGTR